MTDVPEDRPRSIPARFEAPLTESELQIETPLGIDADTPSSFTWIGYEEYEEQIATKSEVEQAAFTATPGVPGNPSTPAADATPPQDATAPPEDTPEEAPAPAAASPLAPGGDVMAAAQAWADMLTRAGAETKEETKEATPREEKPTPEPAEKPKPVEEPKPPKPQPSPEPPAEDSGSPEAAPGEAAEKDSDATSVLDIDIDELKLGKPVARQGLEVKPRRPEFTTLMSLTSAPGNPLVEIRFGADGKPRTAAILESTGDSRVDRALETSLYKWRARGKKLDDLTGKRTVNVQIRILLGGRR